LPVPAEPTITIRFMPGLGELRNKIKMR